MDIKIPDKIQVGGFQYRVVWDDGENLDPGGFGDVSHGRRRIRFKIGQSDSELTNTVIHELTHCVDNVYLETTLTENQIRVIANGLHQVLQSMGIRFVR